MCSTWGIDEGTATWDGDMGTAIRSTWGLTRGRGDLGLSREVDSACCEPAAKDVVAVCTLYMVLEGMGEDTREGKTYID